MSSNAFRDRRLAARLAGATNTSKLFPIARVGGIRLNSVSFSLGMGRLLLSTFMQRRPENSVSKTQSQQLVKYVFAAYACPLTPMISPIKVILPSSEPFADSFVHTIGCPPP